MCVEWCRRGGYDIYKRTASETLADFIEHGCIHSSPLRTPYDLGVDDKITGTSGLSMAKFRRDQTTSSRAAAAAASAVASISAP